MYLAWEKARILLLAIGNCTPFWRGIQPVCAEHVRHEKALLPRNFCPPWAGRKGLGAGIGESACMGMG